MKNFIINISKVFFVFSIVIFGIFVYTFIVFSNSALNVSNQGMIINITKGTSAKRLAHDLEEKKIINNATLFYIMAKVYSLDKKLQIGEYLLNDIITTKELLFNIANGKVVQYPFTIIEGWNIYKLKEAIKNDNRLAKKITEWDINSLKKQLKISEKHLEGVFLPDTYYYTKGMSDLELLKRIYKEQQKFIKSEWKKRDKSVSLNNIYEALILASIVERETTHYDEMEMIAGVYLKRLDLNMKLQADPTVIYGIDPNFKGLLSKKDLQSKSKYNTYVYKGLPPTPISMPSKQAIKAVLHPKMTKNLYFVSDKKGRHIFSATLKEHVRAKNSKVK